MPSTETKFKILLAASEVMGYAKTGGLADVAASLPHALAERGHDCTILLPLYRCARTGAIPVAPTEHTLSIPLGGRRLAGRLWRSTLPESRVPVYLVEQNELFDRDERRFGHGLYQFSATAGEKRDYRDNCLRFAFFCRAVLESMRVLDLWPEIVHLNDWQTGLIPVYLREMYRHHSDARLREHYRRIRTLLTIHNIAYQGLFPPGEFAGLGLDWRLFNYHQLEFHNHLNCLKAGIVFSDLLNTVSPTYAREIQTPYFGWGMQDCLRERGGRLFGIVNGVDYSQWDPATDVHLPANYSVDQVQPGKGICKAALQKRFGLAEEPRIPLLGVVARLVEQKGIPFLVAGLPTLLKDCQVVVLGEGEGRYHDQLTALQQAAPRRLGVFLGFDEPLAHRIEAGADIFLMPSEYEPSGLNQLYSMKYGTVPVVRATGGLADTVVDCTPQTLSQGEATGFRFVALTTDAFLEATHRAVALYQHQPTAWMQLLLTGMRQDWSWQRSAAEYEKLYGRLRDYDA